MNDDNTLRTQPTDEERARFEMFPEHRLFTHEEFYIFKNYLRERIATVNANVIRKIQNDTQGQHVLRLREEERVLRYISDALYDIWFKRNMYRYLPNRTSHTEGND